MSIRGIRGAITVEQDQAQNLIQATQDLLSEILRANPNCSSKTWRAPSSPSPLICARFFRPQPRARWVGHMSQ